MSLITWCARGARALTLREAQRAVDAQPEVTLRSVDSAVDGRRVVGPGAQPEVGAHLRGVVERVEDDDAGADEPAHRAEVGQEDAELHLRVHVQT